MKVMDLAAELNMEELTGVGGENEITGVYVCDLLSRVMSGCAEGDAWITVQTHLNTLAVAELNDAACIIIPESIAVEAAVLQKAQEKEIAVLSSMMTAYELSWRIHGLLSRTEA